MFACLTRTDVNINIPHFDSMARELAGSSGTGYWTSSKFELRYGAEFLADRGSEATKGIDVFQDFPDSNRGMDFIMNDGSYVEVKAWEGYPNIWIEEMDDQLRRNIGISKDGTTRLDRGRYTGLKYEYVFRGKENGEVIAKLCTVVRQAVVLGIFTMEHYNYFNITFMDLPLDVVLDKATNKPPVPNTKIIKCPVFNPN